MALASVVITTQLSKCLNDRGNDGVVFVDHRRLPVDLAHDQERFSERVTLLLDVGQKSVDREVDVVVVLAKWKRVEIYVGHFAGQPLAAPR